MNFTPQQLAGAGKYNAKVLIGNWNEDLALSDVKSKAARRYKALGERHVDKSRSNTWAGSQPEVLSFVDDGIVRLGHTVNLRHDATNCNLAGNMTEPTAAPVPGLKLFQASGAPGRSLRTSFLILPAPGKRAKAQGECLEFGDEILLATEPTLRVDPHSGLCQNPFYLMSAPASAMGGPGNSGQQGVRIAQVIDTCSNAYLRWRVEPLVAPMPSALAKDRLVRAFEPIQLVHCSTGKSLALDSTFSVYSDYGAELELFCCLDKKPSKVHLLKAEHSGKRAPDHRVPVQARNAWTIEAACEPGQHEFKSGDESMPGASMITPEAVLELVRDQVHMIDGGLDALRTFLDALDRCRDGALDLVSFKWGLIDFGVNLSEDEFSCLLHTFQHAGGVPLAQFIESLEA